jgi:hypothetical protein
MASSRAVDALAVASAKLAVSATVLALGFRAVSDDDYARLVIAQRFAESPSLDPSGTSWLPLPFWVYGAAFRLFGNELTVARGVALLLGALSAVGVWWASRTLGAGRAGAIAAGILAAAFSWSAWLGAAPLPEAPTAGLLVVALAALPLESLRVRMLGAAAVAAACFCRYEAWPVALAVAGFALADARRVRSRQLLVAALLALAPIALWLAHGVVRHGDAIFFVRRVAAYRHALGESDSIVSALGPLRSLFLGAPEVVLPLVLGLARTGIPASFRRPFAGAAALVGFLMLGESGGGGPTHHAERALLPVWFLAAAMLGEVAGRWPRARAGFLGLVFAGTLALLALRGPSLPDFADRRDALAIGQRARELGASALLVDTPDYAHLAVAAAYGRPTRSAPFDDRDPRTPRPPDAFASPAALAERLRTAAPSTWLVVTRAHAPVALAAGTERASNASFLLVAPHGITSR